MTYKEIIDTLGLSEEPAKECMMKLCNPKKKLLLKQNSKVSRFEPGELIKVNR